MRNPQLYVSVLVLGVIVLVIGVLLLAKVFGEHHTLPYITLVVGALLVIVGIVGMLGTRSRSVL